MGKRANPFVEDFMPQSKVHVGLKQFNNSDDDRLKKVYEKTLDLLFKGSKKILASDTCHYTDLITTKKDKMRQLFIGKDGALLHSGSLIKDNIKVTPCVCGHAAAYPCAYCERSLCGSCQHACSCCEKAYCTQCILVGLEGLEICKSCYH